jgi:hypothetical protein
MSLRWSVLLLAATSAFAAEYKASDDGRVVYFTGAPVDEYVPNRLWRWTNSNIETLLDTYAPNQNQTEIRIPRLTPDGRLALISTSRLLPDFRTERRWQIRLDGATRPLVEIADAQLVSMSPNGRWVVIYRNEPGRAVELFELSEAGLRSTAIWPDPRPNGLPSYDQAFPAMVSDDALVRAGCDTCIWNSRTGVTQQQLIPFDGTARTFYQWHFNPRHRGQTLYNAAGGELGLNCFNPVFAVLASDPTGRRAHLRCGEQHLLYNADDTNRVTNLPPEATLNSTLTAILTRPTATQFLWQPLDGRTPQPLDRFDILPLISAISPWGLFATSDTPDFTLEWGGQMLPWLQSSLGYHYAFLPADIVPGAVDSFRLTSPTRPWLNVQRDRTVAREALAAVPINAADPRFLFIHEDYSGLVTPDSPARPGEHIHLYVTGLDPNGADLDLPTSFASIFEPPNPNLGSQQGALPLRAIAIQPSGYSRSLQLLTLEVHPQIVFYAGPAQTVFLRLQLNKKAGNGLSATGPVWFSISPN